MITQNIAKTKFTLYNKQSKPVTLSLNTLEVKFLKYLKDVYPNNKAALGLTVMGYRQVITYFFARIKLTYMLKDFDTLCKKLHPVLTKFAGN